MHFTYRSLSLITGLLAISAVIVTIVLQMFMQLSPCPLCVFQRVAYIALGMTLLLAAAHQPKTKHLQSAYLSISVLFTLIGFCIAARHLWLIHLPEGAKPGCGPGLNYLLDTFAPIEVFEIVFRGSGDCAKVDKLLFGLSIPFWSLLTFSGLFLLQAWIAFKIKKG